MITYTVYDIQDSTSAASGLTSHEVVRHIYTDDGAGFVISPRMIDGEQAVHHEFGLEWDVRFTRNGRAGPAFLTTSGATIEDAEHEFLSDAFKWARWDASRWMVLTDDQFMRWLSSMGSDE